MVTPTEDYYPDHDGGKFAPILATTVATWRAHAFLENLAVDAEGEIFVTVYSHNRIDRYDPATRTTTTFAEVPAPPMGLAFDASGVLWTTGGTLYEGPGFIWRVERTGAVRQWCELPDATPHERLHDASEWANASGLRELLRPYPRDRSWPTWPLGRVASGGST